ncbi:MAG: hypothetical protein AB1831_06355 [Pseudomonadota bacterium]
MSASMILLPYLAIAVAHALLHRRPDAPWLEALGNGLVWPANLLCRCLDLLVEPLLAWLSNEECGLR